MKSRRHPVASPGFATSPTNRRSPSSSITTPTWTTLAWVRVDGLATVLERGDQRPAALQALRARYPQYRQMALEGLPLIVIAPIAVAGWRWANG